MLDGNEKGLTDHPVILATSGLQKNSLSGGKMKRKNPDLLCLIISPEHIFSPLLISN
jgi:hypothetical protein